jgi:adenylate cyclase
MLEISGVPMRETMTGERLTPAEFAAVRRSIIIHATVVAAPVSAAISVYNAIWEETNYSSHLIQAAVNFGQSTVLLVVVLIGANLLLRYRLAPHARWAVDGQPPTPEDAALLVRLPVRAAVWIVSFVSVSTTVITVVDLAIYGQPVTAAGIAIGFYLTGFTFGAITYLQTERALRPLFALALTSTGVPPRRSVGIRPRLVFTWLLGSALPLLFIIAIPLRANSGNLLPLVVPMLYMAIGGLLLGGIMATLGARSVAEPLESVRSGLDAVRDGNLDVELPVTNPGDLGQLLAGFNQMVTGLRERRTLEDLFGRHVGEDVARQALSSGLELGGELRTVTALFVDMIASTAFSETHAPDVVVARVNELFQAVFDEVTAAGGWINKFEGDGCLCVFGAPMDLEGHVAHGLSAARSLGARLDAIGLPVGIGVSCGEVVAGNVGSIERFEYTVIGRPVNEASRLTEAAKTVPGHVLASYQAVQASGPEAQHWVADGTLELRGLLEPLPVAVPAIPASREAPSA